MAKVVKAVLEFLTEYEANASRMAFRSRMDNLISSLRPNTRGLAQNWCTGVVRHRLTLWSLATHSSKRIFKKAKPELQAATLLAIWRLISNEPAEEVVSSFESLIATKLFDKLKRCLDELSPKFIGNSTYNISELTWQKLQSGQFIPLPSLKVAQFSQDCLDLEGRSLSAQISRVFSLPEDLVSHWIEQFGDDTVEMARACNEPAPLFLRTQSLKVTRAELQQKLAAEQIQTEVVEDLPHALKVIEGQSKFRSTSAFKDGLFTIQDLTSQWAPLTLEPKPEESILDLCAAPGGKTCYLAELADDKARVVAVDRKDRRLQKVEQTAERIGLSSIELLCADGREPDFCDEQFDAILLDAPCSNTGVLRRRPEARWNYSKKNQKRFVQDQRALAFTAYQRLKPGGRLLYSVCSVESEEGAGVIEWLQRRCRDIKVVEQRIHKPVVGSHDGGFQLLAVKDAS